MLISSLISKATIPDAFFLKRFSGSPSTLYDFKRFSGSPSAHVPRGSSFQLCNFRFGGVWKPVNNSEDLFPQSPFSRRETGASRIVMFKMVIYTFVKFHTFSTSVDLENTGSPRPLCWAAPAPKKSSFFCSSPAIYIYLLNEFTKCLYSGRV